MFEAPCSRLLCCNREEVEEMKEQYNILRLKTVALQTQVGRQLTVQWTDEDSDLSMTTWAGDVRICEVTRYLAAQKKYVLRFKCGYEKIVDALPLIQMVESSADVMASKKVKTKKGVVQATQEWEQDISTKCTIPNADERCATVPALVVDIDAANFAETEARLLREQKELQQRASVLRMQQEEATATALALQAKAAAEKSQKKKEDDDALAYAEQERLRKESEAATATAIALQEKEAAETLQKKKENDDALAFAAQEQLRKESEASTATALALQARVAAETLQKKKEDDDALASAEQERLRKESEVSARDNEEREGIIKGTYPKQDLFKTLDYLREHGMGKGWHTDLQLPDHLPTFYVDDTLNSPAAQNEAPKEEPQPESFKSMIEGLVQQELDRRGSQILAPKPSNRKRKRAARRIHVKVEKVNDEGPRNEVSDSDSSVEFLQNSANTARRILWQRGHNAMLPSMKKQIIEDATVDSVAEAHGPLKEYGFAIVRDMAEAFAPKNRCTREQRDFITKCKATIM